MSLKHTPFHTADTNIYLAHGLGGFSVRHCPDAEKLAAMIVRAVNGHDALVKALEDVVPILPGYVIDLRSGGLETFGAKVDGIAVKARAALALAREDAA